MTYHNDPYLNDFENRIEAARQRENEMSSLDFNPEVEIEIVAEDYDDVDDNELYDDDEPYDDGQPDEYTEWQDYMGGDDWDHGQYEHDPAEYEWDCDLHNEF